MEENDKKFYELTEEERKERNRQFWKKAKPIIKRVLFGAFCVAICLLMVFGLLSGMFKGKENKTSECIMILFNILKLAA